MKIIFILVICFLSYCCPAQDFGKKGTVWQHCIIPILEFPITYDYIELSSVRDTTIQNLQCHELVITHRYTGFPPNRSILICNDLEKVYYMEGDSFHLLYNFSLGSGDSYLVRYPIGFDTSYLNQFPASEIYDEIHIDSVGTKNVNGGLLKVQYISVVHPHGILFGNYAIEKIGYDQWVLPFFAFHSTDSDIFTGLHSFKDSDISFQDSSSRCLLLSDYSLKKQEKEIILFPVPAYDHLDLESPKNNDIQNIHIFDLSGKSFPFKVEKSFDKIVLHFQLDSGLYFVETQLTNGEVVYTKFIIGN